MVIKSKLQNRHIVYNNIMKQWYRQISNISRTFGGQLNCWSVRCSKSIACRRCSNYIFILDLTHGFNRLGKDNCKTRRETFEFWDLVRLILEIWWYGMSFTAFLKWTFCFWWTSIDRASWRGIDGSTVLYSMDSNNSGWSLFKLVYIHFIIYPNIYILSITTDGANTCAVTRWFLSMGFNNCVLNIIVRLSSVILLINIVLW